MRGRDFAGLELFCNGTQEFALPNQKGRMATSMATGTMTQVWPEASTLCVSSMRGAAHDLESPL